MIKCNDFECEEDEILTNELIENSCVAYNPKKCLNCSTINDLLLQDANNRVRFYKNPIKLLFNEDVDPAVNQKFLRDIQETCKDIKIGEISLNNTPIILPNLLQLTSDYEKIIKRIESLGFTLETSNAYNFIINIFKISKLPLKLKLQEGLKNNNIAFLSRHIKYVLDKFNCSSRLIHDPVIIPINIQLFFGKLVSSTDANFNSVIEYLNKKPQGCLEAIINTATNILDPAFNIQNGGKKKIQNKSKQKHQKTKKKQKTKKTN
jgi:hypothetical protein